MISRSPSGICLLCGQIDFWACYWRFFRQIREALPPNPDRGLCIPRFDRLHGKDGGGAAGAAPNQDRRIGSGTSATVIRHMGPEPCFGAGG